MLDYVPVVMAALNWNAIGALAGVIGLLIAVGAMARRGVRGYLNERSRPRTQMKTDIDDVKVQVKEIRGLVGTISESLTGREPTPLEPRPPPGLVGIVIHHGEMLTQQGALIEEIRDQRKGTDGPS